MFPINDDDTWYAGSVLITLRQGIRQSSRLARELAADAIVGTEALGLLGRLQAIDSELEEIARPNVEMRLASNDPFWKRPPHTILQEASGHNGM
jgi:hypothetical protein